MTTETPTEQPEDAVRRALLDLALATHGPIADEPLERVRGTLEALRKAAAMLRAVPLSNADEPGIVFHAYRAD